MIFEQPNLKPFPEKLLSEAQTIMRNAVFAVIENKLDEMDGEAFKETGLSLVVTDISGAAALYGFTFKEVRYIGTIMEISFEETDLVMRVEF